MNRNEAKKKIHKLRDDINYHNYQYYVKNNPVISDYEYDMLLKKLEDLEAQLASFVGSAEFRQCQRLHDKPVCSGVEPKVTPGTSNIAADGCYFRLFNERPFVIPGPQLQ